LKYYLDEDISSKVAELLRSKGLDAVSVHERGLAGAQDEEQLKAAALEGRALVTRNRNDFIALTARFYETFQPHCGLVIVPHSISGADFEFLADRLEAFAKKNPKGLEPYTIT
jgi:predicted nuclease of predicted toxin-antitoxin system